MVAVTRYYRIAGVTDSEHSMLFSRLRSVFDDLVSIQTEACFYVENTAPLTTEEQQKLLWLLTVTFEPHNLSTSTFLARQSEDCTAHYVIVEFGPRLSFCTAWSTNAVAMCNNVGIESVQRLEKSLRYRLNFSNQIDVSGVIELASPLLHDRMTHCRYEEPLTSFQLSTKPVAWKYLNVIEHGEKALIDFGESLGLAYDEEDVNLYMNLFKDRLKRNPTDVECYDLAQSNSEHSRHWFFNGRLCIDGKLEEQSLFQIVKQPLKSNPSNSVLAFSDNASAIRGGERRLLIPEKAGLAEPSVYTEVVADHDITFTAETHNFPCGIAPFPGAETGSGGRMRDGHAAGKGSLLAAGTAGYCVGCLHMNNNELPWESKEFQYPTNMAKPLQILVEASDGASDYGNKFGEPLINGFTRSFGLRLPNMERREWIKPIVFVGGMGTIDHHHLKKDTPEVGMLIVKLGGPAYRIGMGGGSASSQIAGSNEAALDFNAVQRGDAKMLQCVNRVVRACVEMGTANPIVSIHDQGAGGNANVLKEIVYPTGGFVDISKILCGDKTMSVLERWGAEYQESDALLIKAADKQLFERLCQREHCPFSIVGHITGDGCIRVRDMESTEYVVDLPLEEVLGKLPPKTFADKIVEKQLKPLLLPPSETIRTSLTRVLCSLSVSSKRFLMHKVDRCVTGLVGQQQSCGPLEVPVADYAIAAHSQFGITGTATAIGEQPLKGLIDTIKMARLSVTEALTNLMFAKVGDIRTVKASGNWMWAAKMEGEVSEISGAAKAMAEIMINVGIAIDGGKDSLSMACYVPQTKEKVKSPGELTISVYAECNDITCGVTPDLKYYEEGVLFYVNLDASGCYPLGGSALAYVYKQIGDDCPNVEEEKLVNTWNAVQHLLETKLIGAGHDVSDGGMLVTVLEMAFSGNCGVSIEMEDVTVDGMNLLFSESPGVVFEVHKRNVEAVKEIMEKYKVDVMAIGKGELLDVVKVSINGTTVIEEKMTTLRDEWESTSFEIEKLQRNNVNVMEEYGGMKDRKAPPYDLKFQYFPTAPEILSAQQKYKVAIIRDEGSNGDREMAAAFYYAGMEPWDVTMSDLLDCRINLSQFNGLAFVGGFSYGDTLESAKGWSASIKLNEHVLQQFSAFLSREDTFSLGVCNGCQLLALLGWIPGSEWCLPETSQPRFIHNKSGKYECRFVSVKVLDSPSIFFKGMQDSTLGVWVAHGEGYAAFPDTSVLDRVKAGGLIPAVYVNGNNEATEQYPFNPNGSPAGIVGMCSPNGRHLGLMPHPERSLMMWQWPYAPPSWKEASIQKAHLSPWIQMFQNARRWCESIST